MLLAVPVPNTGLTVLDGTWKKFDAAGRVLLLLSPNFMMSMMVTMVTMWMMSIDDEDDEHDGDDDD